MGGSGGRRGLRGRWGWGFGFGRKVFGVGGGRTDGENDEGDRFSGVG